MESVTLFRLVMACLGGVSLAAALYQWWGERQQAFVSDVHFVLHRVLIGGSIAFIAQYACVVIVTLHGTPNPDGTTGDILEIPALTVVSDIGSNLLVLIGQIAIFSLVFVTNKYTSLAVDFKIDEAKLGFLRRVLIACWTIELLILLVVCIMRPLTNKLAYGAVFLSSTVIFSLLFLCVAWWNIRTLWIHVASVSSQTVSTGSSSSDKMKSFVFFMAIATAGLLAMIGAQLNTIIFYFGSWDSIKCFYRRRTSIDPFGPVALVLFAIGLAYGMRGASTESRKESISPSQMSMGAPATRRGTHARNDVVTLVSASDQNSSSSGPDSSV